MSPKCRISIYKHKVESPRKTPTCERMCSRNLLWTPIPRYRGNFAPRLTNYLRSGCWRQENNNKIINKQIVSKGNTSRIIYWWKIAGHCMIARSVIFKLNHSMNEMCVYSYFEIKDQQSDEPNKLVMFLSCRNFAQSINVMAKLVFFFFFFLGFPSMCIATFSTSSDCYLYRKLVQLFPLCRKCNAKFRAKSESWEMI